MLLLAEHIRGWYKRYWWLTPVSIFIVWRLVIEIIGRIALATQPGIVIPWPDNPHPPLWARWDSGWYYAIVNFGYTLKDAGHMSNVTFFPLYPIAWKTVELITPFKNFCAGVVAAHIFSFFGFIIFYRWVQERWNTAVATKSLAVLSVFPTSFFFISAYSESTLFICTAAFFLFSSRKHWIRAACVAAIASATRPTGILLWPTLMYLWIDYYKNKPKPLVELVSVLLLPPLGLIGFSVFLHYTVGNAFAWFTGQSAAGRHFVSPLRLVFAYGKNIVTFQTDWFKHLIEMGTLIFSLTLIPRLKKIHSGYVLYVLLNLAPSLTSNTLTSIQRFILIVAPLFVAVALTRRKTYSIYCIVAGGFLVYSITSFVAFRWAG